jgi:hypothetical protein
MLLHRPTEGSEPIAQPAVVDVSAARPLGIIDPVGHDDVDVHHSDRS